MAKLFQHKGVLYAHSPVSLSGGFKKMILRLSEKAATNGAAGCQFNHMQILTLVCRQLESAAGGSACVAFPLNESTICTVCEVCMAQFVYLIKVLSVVYICCAKLVSFCLFQPPTYLARNVDFESHAYTFKLHYNVFAVNDSAKNVLTFGCHHQTSQYEAVQRAIENEKFELQVTVEKDDDDITSGTILRRAIQHGLVSSLLKQGWTSLDDDVLLMGNIATWEEGQPLLALSLEAVHLDKEDQLVFVFSPDVLCFRRAKPISVLPEAWRNKFSDGQIIDMTDILHCDNGDISHEFQCCVLPSMKQGHIAGIAKNLPENKGFYQRQLFWTCQYGIEVPKSCFYVNVLLQRPDGDNDNLWLPSSLILKKSGLMPAAPSVRCSKAACSLEHFRRSVAEWNFFNAGHICFEAYASEKNHVNQCVTWTTVSKTLLPSIQPGYGCTKGWNDAQFGSAEFGTELQTLTNSSLCSIKKFYRPKPFLNVTHGVKEEPKKKIHAVVTPPLQIKPFMPRVSLRQTIPGVQKPPTNITPMPFSRKEEHRQIEISYSKDKKISPIGVQKPPTNITPMHFSRKEEHRQIEISYSKDKKISPIGALEISHPGLLKFKRKTSSKGGDIMSKKSSSKKSLKGDDRCSRTAKPKVSGEGSCSAAGQIGRLHLSSQSGSSPGRTGSTIEKGSRSHRAASATNFEGPITDVHSNFNQIDKLRTSSPTLCNPIAAAHSESNTAVDALVYEKHAESRLKELNVTNLKNFLRSRKAKLSGRKEELIERIQQLLSK